MSIKCVFEFPWSHVTTPVFVFINHFKSAVESCWSGLNTLKSTDYELDGALKPDLTALFI